MIIETARDNGKVLFAYIAASRVRLLNYAAKQDKYIAGDARTSLVVYRVCEGISVRVALLYIR